MKYPVRIRNKVSELEKIIDEWPIDIEIHDVISWILQFETRILI